MNDSYWVLYALGDLLVYKLMARILFSFLEKVHLLVPKLLKGLHFCS